MQFWENYMSLSMFDMLCKICRISFSTLIDVRFLLLKLIQNGQHILWKFWDYL